MIKYEIRLNPQITWRKIDQKIVVLNSENQEQYLLNKLGSRIWNDFTQGRSFTRTIRSMVKEYAICQERAEHDVNAFLKTMAAKKIISLKIDT